MVLLVLSLVLVINGISLKQQFNECNFIECNSIELINGKVKQIEIKNQTYYNDIIKIEKLNSNLLKIDKKSYKDVDIYYIGYITIKKIGDCENIYSVNALYLIIGKVDGHIECNSVQ